MMNLMCLLTSIGMAFPGVGGETLQRRPAPPIKVIFDTDMGSDCDDVGALALLHAYADMGKAEIIGCIFSSGRVPYGAGIVEAINIYYGRPNIPIGAYHKDDIGDPVDKMNAQKLVKNTRTFGHTIMHNRDAQEQTRLNRKLLGQQGDRSVTYITVGHTKGLYDLLVSAPDDLSPLTGAELAKKKLLRWVALGALGANNEARQYKKDWNFFFNDTAPYTKHLVENFPAPIYFIDAGSDVMTGKSLKKAPAGTIVRAAYREWLWNYSKKTLDDQRPSWDLAAVYYAIEGVGAFLVNTGKGELEFDLEKGCRWISGSKGSAQTSICQKEGVNIEFADYLNRLIALTPKSRQ
jgi:hypothetical protein